MTVRASAVRGSSRFKLTVTTNCTDRFRFRVAKRHTRIVRQGSDDPVTVVSWRYLKGYHWATGTPAVKTLNLPKGYYRATVDATCGYLATTTNQVRLKR
jgi:hypothetical protein